jgi:hypothetical protein
MFTQVNDFFFADEILSGPHQDHAEVRSTNKPAWISDYSERETNAELSALLKRASK